MINLISTLVLAGILSASGAAYVLDIRTHAEETTDAYVESAESRFEIYEEMIPGLVEFPLANTEILPSEIQNN